MTGCFHLSGDRKWFDGAAQQSRGEPLHSNVSSCVQNKYWPPAGSPTGCRAHPCTPTIERVIKQTKKLVLAVKTKKNSLRKINYIFGFKQSWEIISAKA